MSEIKVNKISPRAACGTVQLGDSGDTFTIPAGATINNQGTATNFGATGSASWNTTVKTGDFTAVAGEGYFVNTTSGEIDVTLPAGTAGAVVAVKDYAKTWDTNNCVIISNGSEKIGGSTNNAILSTEGLAVTLVYVDSTQGWLVTDDGLQSQANTNAYMIATGGTITEDGNCKVHTFTGPGTFCVSTVALNAADNVVSYLVVAGGGSGGPKYSPGGQNAAGAGGGAGGFRELVSPSSPYTGSPLNGYPSAPNRITVTAAGIPIAIGAGGAATPGTPPGITGNPGSVSTFSTITSAGGGGGGQDTVGGDAGGSGGGRGGESNPGPGGAGNTPPTTPPQGNPGGAGGFSSPAYGTGGGGGATAAGVDGTTSASGAGGAGGTTEIDGTSRAYSGGGGGGSYAGTVAPGGTGNPGGAGGQSPGNASGAGTTNRGGGGGGGGGPSSPVPEARGAAGGSGIVIIRYRFQ